MHLPPLTRPLLLFVAAGLSILSPSCHAAGEANKAKPPGITDPAHAIPFGFPFTLGHWNIRWFPGGHPTKSTPKTTQTQQKGVLEVLKQEKPDLLFACEIRNLAALEDLKTDYPWIACTDIPRTEEEDPSLPQQGLAFLSRFAWKEIWNLDFSAIPETPDKPSRGILAASFETPSGRKLTVYGVHLKSNRGDAASNHLRRRKALDHLQNDWKERGLDPARDEIVILGDFNTSPDDPAFSEEATLKHLADLGFANAADSLPADKRATIPASDRFPANNFDHIYLSPALAAKQTGSQLRIVPIDTRTVSDHYPLFLRME
jgi:endonuclease/exonuclease/phosphatase family metal-dependent hydrolase